MSGISRILGIGGKKESEHEHGSTIGKLLVASRGAIGVPDQEHRPINVPRMSTGSTKSESSDNTNSGSSLFENSGPRSFDEVSSVSSLASPRPDVDPNIAIFSGIRHERVTDLTGRVKTSSLRPFFEGNYSNVWTGTLDGTQFVAIKCLKDQKIRPEKAQRRFKREVGTWWCLRHENVIPLLGLVYDEGLGASGAIVSPWYKNGSAVTYLSNPERPVSMTARIDLFYGVVNGIHYLHTFDTTKSIEHPSMDPKHESEDGGTILVHGDLKPLNILIDDNGVPKLCDFGLLRLVRDSSPSGVTTTSTHTGTTRYLCYELVADDANPTTASDIHALASVGLEFLFSTPPYAHIHSSHMLDYKITKAIEAKEPPATRPNGISGVVSTLWDMFDQCWSTEPEGRPDSYTVRDYLHKNRDNLIAAMQ